MTVRVEVVDGVEDPVQLDELGMRGILGVGVEGIVRGELEARGFQGRVELSARDDAGKARIPERRERRDHVLDARRPPQGRITGEKVEVRLALATRHMPGRVGEEARVLREGRVDRPVNAVIDLAHVAVLTEGAEERGDLFRGLGGESPSEHGGREYSRARQSGLSSMRRNCYMRPMRKRPLGKTGLEVSELSLGTWGLSGDGYGPVKEFEVERVIDRALELGIDLIDTADVYGDGAMESKLGERLEGRADKPIIVTKVGTDRHAQPRAKKCFDPGYLREAVDRSRERLRSPTIDIVLLHNPSLSTLMREEAAALMKELVAEGAIKAWGASVGDVDTARAALASGAEVIEIAYNAYFSRDLHELSGDLAVSGAGVLARSVLAHGLLAGLFHPSRAFAPDDHRVQRWSREELGTRLRQLEAIRSLVGGDVLTQRALALRFVLCNQLVSTAVLGPRTVPQLEQLVREAGKGPPYLADDVLARLPDNLKKMEVNS